MERNISTFKIKKSGIYNSINPISSKTTIQPIWSGMGYKLTIRLNLLAKILTVLAFPINVILEGISETINYTSKVLKTGTPLSRVYAENSAHFAKAKELYESAKT